MSDDQHAPTTAQHAGETDARDHADTPPERAPGLTSTGKVRTTRAGAWWTGLVLAAVVSVVFLVFIAQNADAVTIRFLGLDGELSLAVALLLSAAIGALVVALPGAARIIQLRRALTRATRDRKH